MKPGAGDDLLSDDDDGQDENEDVVAEDEVADQLASTDAVDSTESDDETDPETGESGVEKEYVLPWIHRRNTVKSDRPEVIQLHVRQETVDGEDALQDDVEDLLNEDVYALDLREAAYLVAMQHPDEVADQLREWGYDFE